MGKQIIRRNQLTGNKVKALKIFCILYLEELRDLNLFATCNRERNTWRLTAHRYICEEQQSKRICAVMDEETV